MDQNINPEPDPNPVSDKPAGDILNELRELGQNLRTLLQSAWESDERRKLQQEIETGVNDLHDSLSQAIRDFSGSPAGQNLKSDLDELGERFRSGELETKIRTEVVSALRAANEGLRQVSFQDSTEDATAKEDREET